MDGRAAGGRARVALRDDVGGDNTRDEECRFSAVGRGLKPWGYSLRYENRMSKNCLVFVEAARPRVVGGC